MLWDVNAVVAFRHPLHDISSDKSSNSRSLLRKRVRRDAHQSIKRSYFLAVLLGMELEYVGCLQLARNS